MYQEYKCEMFKRLDAEFALILYDHESDSLIAARDPIGIRPLFYGYDSNNNIIFASEAKNLISIVKRLFPSLLDIIIRVESLFVIEISLM